MNISVVLALPEHQQLLLLSVPTGCTARQAVHLAVDAGLDFSGSEVTPEEAKLGVFAEIVADETVLNSGDRVEIYRPLKQDPMALRRARASART